MGTGWGAFSLQIGTGLLLMVGLLFFAVPGLQTWFDWPFWQRALMLMVWVGAGALVYFVGLYLLGFRLGKFRAQH